jgi:hypothetical protein
MERPNYRLGKIEEIGEASIIAGVTIRSSSQKIEERSHTKDCSCNSECRCDTYCKCDNYCKDCQDHCGREKIEPCVLT